MRSNIFNTTIKSLKDIKILRAIELEYGLVVQCGDGLAKVYGLRNVKIGELIVFSSEFSTQENNNNFENITTKGIALSLEKDAVQIALFGNETSVGEGYYAFRTNKVITIPVGEPVLGHVVDSLGEFIDGTKPKRALTKHLAIEARAPALSTRLSVHEPLQTGVILVDSMIPIGRGQRELLIGDRQTGKTTVTVDTIINQRTAHIKNEMNNKVFCIYAAIGLKRSDIKYLQRRLELEDAMFYTTIVAATASEAIALQFIAPYTAVTLGEYFRDTGRHALVIYDDLSKHAMAYRQISLLLRRAPGRDAYPGDIFYLHARLLERAAKLNSKYGSGSLTAFPLIETQFSDVSAYIATNVIPITDGQVFFDKMLFNQGIMPPINIGLSVSRVGAAAQTVAMKKLARSLKFELIQFNEVQAFVSFSADLDPITIQTLERGSRLLEILKQGEFVPYSLEQELVLIFAGLSGLLDNIPVIYIAATIKKLSRLVAAGDIFVTYTKENELNTKELYTLLTKFIK